MEYRCSIVKALRQSAFKISQNLQVLQLRFSCDYSYISAYYSNCHTYEKNLNALFRLVEPILPLCETSLLSCESTFLSRSTFNTS